MARQVCKDPANNQIELQKKILQTYPVFIFVSSHSKGRAKMRIFIYVPELLNRHIFNIKTTEMLLMIEKLG